MDLPLAGDITGLLMASGVAAAVVRGDSATAAGPCADGMPEGLRV